MDVEHRAEQRGVVDHDVVAEQHRERLVADVLARDGHRVTEPERIALSDVVDVGEVVDDLDVGEHAQLVRLFQVVLELEVAVEVVLDRVLAASGDDEDVGQAGLDRLLDDVLDRRLVDDRQHLLRLALRDRQEPRTQSGGGDHGLGDGSGVVHRVTTLAVRPLLTTRRRRARRGRCPAPRHGRGA